MAPPRITKRTSTTAAQTKHHSNGRDVLQRNRVAMEEEALDVNSESNAMHIDDANDEPPPPPQSQEAEDYGVQELLRTMKDDQRKRHDARKLNITKTYTKSRADAQEVITSVLDEHETEASQAFDAQLSRLQELVKRKTQIEALMAEKLAKLRTDYLVHSLALQKVIEYRLKELR